MSIDAEWNEMCNDLVAGISTQAQIISSIAGKIQQIELSGGVGEAIEEGTEYVVGSTTYTAGVGAEIFNNYEDDSTEYRNKAAGDYSHTEGSSNAAYADYSHAEGKNNTVTGIGSHVEGKDCSLSGNYSHVEGESNTVTTTDSHAEGYGNIITDACNTCHVEGVSNKIYQGGLTGVHIEGGNNTAQTLANYSHIEGQNNTAIGPYDHIEGNNNKTYGSPNGYSHIEGVNNTITSAITSHIEGDANNIIGNSNRSHIEGTSNIIQATWSGGQSWESHIEGKSNLIESASRAHAEGYFNEIYKAESSHVEGYNCIVGDPENRSLNAEAGHAEGYNCKSKNSYAHAQNNSTTASGTASTSMGEYTTASGTDSLSTGKRTVASGIASVSAGIYTIASGDNQLAIGTYNISDSSTVSKTDSNYNYSLTKYPFIIGNGHETFNDPVRSDAFKVDCDGKIYVGSDTTGVDVKVLNDEVVTARSTYQNLNARLDDMPTGCTITTDTTTTTLPAKVVLANNAEYRYLSLTAATGISISIEDATAASGSFYSTLVLHNISSSDPISTFVTVNNDSLIDNIIFLNEDSVDLSQADTMEMMFFTNGMSNVVMCIAYAYTQPVLP